MLTSSRNRVTKSVILPGIISGGIKKLTLTKTQNKYIRMRFKKITITHETITNSPEGK
jgi:hypothetical protein